MKERSKSQWILSVLLFAAALVLLVVGVMGFSSRSGGQVSALMTDMRSQAVLGRAAGSIIDDIALKAKQDARKYADENNYSRNQRAEYASQQEDLAREEARARYLNFSPQQRQAILPGIAGLEALMRDYGALYQQEREVYAESWRAQQAAQTAAPETEDAEAIGADAAVSDDAMLSEEVVDYSGFVASDALLAKEDAIRPAYDALFAQINEALPELPEEAIDDLYRPLTEMVYEPGENFETAYDRYAAASGEQVLEGSDRLRMTVARSGSNWIAFAVGLTVLGLTAFFYKPLTRKLGVPRLVITVFFLLLCVAAALYNLKVTGLIGNVLWRTGMYGVLTLAMLPGIQSGISLNMGMTIGIISGLLSTLIAMEINLTGWSAFLFAIGVGVLFAVPVGLLYGMLLNKLKGSEMTVSTYVGFSYVSLMSIAWMLLPFYNTRLTWALGRGLRVMHNMSSSFGKILDNFLAFELFGVRVPTGLLLFLFFACFLMWLFSRSKAGTAMIAAGNNPRFTEASGIKVDRMRLLGTTLSTVIAAVGIIVYSQSFGFMQLYAGPRQMGFVAASAILIGGASVTRAKVSNVILGTFLFQGVLSIGIQVANEAIEVGGLSEVMRILISNGIILYALTQSGGDSRD